MYLCHKCSGVLTASDEERKTLAYKRLHGCGCISGWVRDWQDPVTLAVAIQDQYQQAERNAQWCRDHPGQDVMAEHYQKLADELLDFLTTPDLAAAGLV